MKVLVDMSKLLEKLPKISWTNNKNELGGVKEPKFTKNRPTTFIIIYKYE